MDEDHSIWSRWYVLPLILVPVGVLVLLAITYPLLPTSKAGWLACFGIVCVFLLCAWLAGIIETRLRYQEHFRSLYRAIAVLMIVAAGVGAFWIFFKNKDFIAANFSYWHF